MLDWQQRWAAARERGKTRRLRLAVLAFALPSVASDLGEFPLPSFLGIQLQGVEVERQGDFLSIFTDLAPGP